MARWSKDGLADLSAGFDARGDGLDRGGGLHEGDVPAAGDVFQTHRRLELADLEGAEVLAGGKGQRALIEVEPARAVTELNVVAERQQQDAIAARKDAQPPELDAGVEPGEVAGSGECGAVHFQARAELAAELHLLQVEIGQWTGTFRLQTQRFQRVGQGRALHSLKLQAVPAFPGDFPGK